MNIRGTTFADWTRMLASDQFNKLAIAEYPGWQLNEKNSPQFVGPFTVVKGDAITSRTMAVAFDDVAQGNFYYRDWTDDGIPFVKEGVEYKSGFWFQYEVDAVKFREMFAESITTK